VRGRKKGTAAITPPCLLQTHHIINRTRNDIQSGAKKKGKKNLKKEKKRETVMNYTAISRKSAPAIDDIHML